MRDNRLSRRQLQRAPQLLSLPDDKDSRGVQIDTTPVIEWRNVIGERHVWAEIKRDHQRYMCQPSSSLVSCELPFPRSQIFRMKQYLAL